MEFLKDNPFLGLGKQKDEVFGKARGPLFGEAEAQ